MPPQKDSHRRGKKTPPRYSGARRASPL